MEKKVISLGAGLQSTAMLLMSLKNEIEPADFAIFADTGWESKETYKNVLSLNEICKQYDFPLYVVSWKNIKKLHLETGNCHIPFFVKGTVSEKGMMLRQCTDKFKLQPMKRFFRSKGFKKIEFWIGISTDEASRMRESGLKWITNRYPLVEKRLSSNQLRHWLIKNGFTIPQKSACIGCPYHSDSFWGEMKRNRTSEFLDAVDFDNKIRNKYGFIEGGELFLHSSRKALSEVDFRTPEELGQINLFENECSGLCAI